MKQVLPVLAASVLLSFASCQKENPRACYSCKTVTRYTANGMPITLPPVPGLPGAFDTTYCDKTQVDIEKIQNAGSSTQNLNFGGYTITSTQVTSCIKN